MSVYFLYHEVSSYRRELIGRADTESQARTLAVSQSRGQRTISISEYTPSTMAMRFVGLFRRGVQNTAAGEQVLGRVAHELAAVPKSI